LRLSPIARQLIDRWRRELRDVARRHVLLRRNVDVVLRQRLRLMRE
jgi:hypothetical protein